MNRPPQALLYANPQQDQKEGRPLGMPLSVGIEPTGPAADLHPSTLRLEHSVLLDVIEYQLEMLLRANRQVPQLHLADDVLGKPSC